MTEKTEEKTEEQMKNKAQALSLCKKIRHDAACTAESAAMILFWHHYLMNTPGGEKHKLSNEILDKIAVAIDLFDEIGETFDKILHPGTEKKE